MAMDIASQGNYQTALDLHIEVLEGYLDKFGKLHPQAATAMANASGCMRALGEDNFFLWKALRRFSIENNQDST